MERSEVERRLESATDRAEQILQSLGVAEIPIDPFAIAGGESPLLKVAIDDFGEAFDGRLEYHRKQDTFLLMVNDKYDRRSVGGRRHPRTRFSMAHELGHFYLDGHHAYLRGGGTSHGSKGEFASDVTVEREADTFAANLLMPESIIRPLVNAEELTMGRIEELAETFDTSLVSTIIRSVRLSDYPCAVSAVRDGKVAWCFCSDALIEGRCYPDSRGALRSPAAAARWQRFLAGDHEKGEAPGEVGDWFRTYGRGHLDALSVTESYLPVAVAGTLIVLLVVPEDELFPNADEE